MKFKYSANTYPDTSLKWIGDTEYHLVTFEQK